MMNREGELITLRMINIRKRTKIVVKQKIEVNVEAAMFSMLVGA